MNAIEFSFEIENNAELDAAYKLDDQTEYETILERVVRDTVSPLIRDNVLVTVQSDAHEFFGETQCHVAHVTIHDEPFND